jgi:hypothetical protein
MGGVGAVWWKQQKHFNTDLHLKPVATLKSLCLSSIFLIFTMEIINALIMVKKK